MIKVVKNIDFQHAEKYHRFVSIVLKNKFDGIEKINENSVFLNFFDDLTLEEASHVDLIDTLSLVEIDSFITANTTLHSAVFFKDLVLKAISFGNEMIVLFAAENVMMGITQAGKTKDVADYLASMTRYLQTGSLYEAINEIDRLIASGLPSDLNPFVSESRMLVFKSKITEYLQA